MNNYNVISEELYQGKNQAELEAKRLKEGYKSSCWLTFLQAKEKGLKIIKGSKSVGVFKGFGSFAKVSEKGKKGEVGHKVSSVSRPLGFAYVFNLDQTEKYEKTD